MGAGRRGGNGPFTRVYMRRHWNIGFATDAHHIRGKIFQRLSTSARVHRPMRPNVLCHRIFTLVKRTPQVYFLSTDLLFRFSSFFFPPFSPVEIVSSFSFPRFRFRFLQRGKMRIVRIGDWKCLKKKKSRLDRRIDLIREPIRNAFVDPRSIMYENIYLTLRSRSTYTHAYSTTKLGEKLNQEERAKRRKHGAWITAWWMETFPNEFSGPIRLLRTRGSTHHFGSIASLTQLSSEAQWHASSFLPSFPLPFRPFLSLSLPLFFFFITRQINDRGWKRPSNKRPISKVPVPLDPRAGINGSSTSSTRNSEIVLHLSFPREREREREERKGRGSDKLSVFRKEGRRLIFRRVF